MEYHSVSPRRLVSRSGGAPSMDVPERLNPENSAAVRRAGIAKNARKNASDAPGKASLIYRKTP